MWDDLSPYLVATGPTSTVLDPDGTSNHILDFPKGGSVQVDWSLSGGLVGIAVALEFTVSLYADPVGPGSNSLVGGAPIVVTAPLPAPPAWHYRATFTIAPSSLPVGAYRLTALITTVIKLPPPSLPVQMPIAGFVDGPIIQVRPGP